jgi:signal transduction histidine kinase
LIPEADIEHRILVLAPTLRDAEVSSRILQDARVRIAPFARMGEILSELECGAGAIVVTDHPAHSVDDLFNLHVALDGQPDWSEIPVICLARSDAQSERLRSLRSLPGAVLLERPVSSRTFLSAVRAALRARARQYELRSQIDQIRRTNRELIDAARAKDEFLATLAHELRNPLGALSNASRILNQAADQPAANAMARKIIDRQIAHMTRLLDDLLDLARITHQRLDLRKRPSDLTGIIEAAVETVQPLIDAKGHRLKLDLPPQPVQILVDPVRISQVVSNLLTNAAKYTEPDGTVELTAREQGEWVEIDVSDNGIGIAPEALATVFGMFTQLDTALDRSESGLGIGLALARGLTRLHGGSIQARSEGLGKGSTFSIRLPLLAGAHPEASDSTLETSRGPPREIVLADDNPDSLESLGELLKIQGHQVRVAHSGEEALRLLDVQLPDVLLLDIGMPGMSGYEVARRVRGLYAPAKIQLIALTGWGQPEDIQLAREAGFDHHLTKPIDLGELDRLLA